MPVPLATTTITVTREETAAGADPYDSTPTSTTIASGVRATIAPPTTATVRLSGGDKVIYKSKLVCDPTVILKADTVTDTSGNVWTVDWVQQVDTLGMSHTLAGLRLVSGST